MPRSEQNSTTDSSVVRIEKQRHIYFIFTDETQTQQPHDIILMFAVYGFTHSIVAGVISLLAMLY